MVTHLPKKRDGMALTWLLILLILLPAGDCIAQGSGQPGKVPSDPSPPELLWAYDDPDAIPMEMAMDASGDLLWVGQSSNYSRAQLFDIDQDHPLWEYCFTKGTWENHVCVATSGDGDLLAALGRETASLVVFDPSALYPHIPIIELSLGPDRYGAWVNISRDGSTIVATAHGLGDTLVIAVLDGTVRPPELLWTMAKEGQRWEGIEGVDLTDDGSTIVVSTYYRLLVLPRSEPLVMQVIDNWGEARAVVSGDGRYIATGDFEGVVSLYEREEMSEPYDLLWSHAEGEGVWITTLAISCDGTTVAAGTFDYYDFSRSSLILFDTWSSEPLWRSAAFGDRVSSIDISDDGSRIVAASWGDLENELYDLAVFELAGSIPLMTLSSPGSFYSCQVSADGSHASGGSKMVHARTMGRGGTVWALVFDDTGLAEEGPHSPACGDGLMISPNPTSGPCTIRWSVPQSHTVSSPAILCIYDATGRQIGKLGPLPMTGNISPIHWDGRDREGKPVSSGIYFFRLSQGSGTAAAKVVVARR